jgi:thioredoxin reductase
MLIIGGGAAGLTAAIAIHRIFVTHKVVHTRSEVVLCSADISRRT